MAKASDRPLGCAGVARFDLPVRVKPDDTGLAERIRATRKHLALLEFQLTLLALDQHWPARLLALQAHAHSDPALGRLRLFFRWQDSASPAPKANRGATAARQTKDAWDAGDRATAQNNRDADRFRQTMDEVCEHTDEQWQAFVSQAFHGGDRWVTRAELPGLLREGLRGDPATLALLKSADLADHWPGPTHTAALSSPRL